MAGVNAEISLAIAATLIGSGDLGNPKLKIDEIRELLQFTPGTDTVGKANLLFADTRTLSASANEDLDLAGSLASAFGATITMAEVVAIFVRAAVGNTNDVRLTRPASNGFAGPFLAAGDGVAIKPGEWQLFASRSGWAVTAGTGDLINLANSAGGTSVSYDILVIGRSVAA